MIKNAESLAAVTHTHTRTFTNEKTLVAFFMPQIKLEISKVTHS